MYNVLRVEFLAPGARIVCHKAWHTSWRRESFKIGRHLTPRLISLPSRFAADLVRGLAFQPQYAFAPHHQPGYEDRQRAARRNRSTTQRLMDSAALIGLAAGLAPAEPPFR